MFALALTMYEIFANHIKWQNTWRSRTRRGGEKRDLCLSTGKVRFHIGDFFKEFEPRGNVRLRKKTNTLVQRETGLLTKCKISKADLPKNLCSRFAKNPTVTWEIYTTVILEKISTIVVAKTAPVGLRCARTIFARTVIALLPCIWTISTRTIMKAV